ncbi:MAG: hypothetical protein ABTQ73_01470 [Caldilineales bacterium]
MSNTVAAQLDAIARDAAALAKNLHYYWDEEGVSELGIFIDPDLFQYLDKLYHESLAFVERCQSLGALAEHLRTA